MSVEALPVEALPVRPGTVRIAAFRPGIEPRLVSFAMGLSAASWPPTRPSVRLKPTRAVFTRNGLKICVSSAEYVCLALSSWVSTVPRGSGWVWGHCHKTSCHRCCLSSEM